jgi:protein-S-isoprenylcysteine O-methyltransferase Ste14
MPLIPHFKIGLWNAWILVFYSLLIAMGIGLLRRLLSRKSKPESEPESTKKKPSKQASAKRSDKTEKKRSKLVILGISTRVVRYLIMLYSIFLPLKLDTTWFYVGFTIYLAGLIISTIARVNFTFGHIDKEPVTQGVYRFSRHPMYVASFLLNTGVGIATASWLFLLFAATSAVSAGIFAIHEERFCLETYGDAYREYMNRTPRWIGIPRRNTPVTPRNTP